MYKSNSNKNKDASFKSKIKTFLYLSETLGPEIFFSISHIKFTDTIKKLKTILQNHNS